MFAAAAATGHTRQPMSSPGLVVVLIIAACFINAGCSRDNAIATDAPRTAKVLFDAYLKARQHRLQEPAAEPELTLGERPFYLVSNMDPGPLKTQLERCATGPFKRTDFTIGHRGAPLGFAEHTREGYIAAANQGAGLVECDTTFTRDRHLVCRHSQCDLHTTTNILATPLGTHCTQPFVPADPDTGSPASARCCTSDITLAEFATLCGRMDGVNPAAQSVEEYLDAPSAALSTGAFSYGVPATGRETTCATLISHKDSLSLMRELDVKFIPELKAAEVPMPYQGDYTQSQYASQLVDAYIDQNIPPSQVWLQSFSLQDLEFWHRTYPAFARQAVFLDNRIRDNPSFAPTLGDMQELKAQGVNIIAPPMFVLLDLDTNGAIVPSAYARSARAAGLDIITWTLERSGPLKEGGGLYYRSITNAINNDGDVFNVLHALAEEVGVRGVFSDWPETVTYYANCTGL